MSYTIVGMFPEYKQAENAAEKLNNEGFSSEDYHISKFKRSVDEAKDYSADDHPHFHFEEEEKTTRFWNWLFGDEDYSKKKYSYVGSKNNVLTVFADTIQNAERAKNILNEKGTINVHKESKDYISSQHADEHSNYEIDESERARIIAKAKNNLYFTNERNYSVGHEGMDNDMDSQGGKDGSV